MQRKLRLNLFWLGFLGGNLLMGIPAVAQTKEDQRVFLERLKAAKAEYQQDSTRIAEANANLPALAEKNACREYFDRLEGDSPRVLIQFGYIDEVSSKDTQDASHQIQAVLTDFLQRCGFSRSGAGWTKEFPIISDKPLKTVSLVIENASQAGKFDEGRSLTVTARYQPSQIKDTLAGYDYFIYFGHSRYGKGMDFYPYRNFKGKHALPIFNESYLDSLPEDLAGVSYVSCFSGDHLRKSGSLDILTQRKTKIVTQEHRVEASNSVSVLMNSLKNF